MQDHPCYCANCLNFKFSQCEYVQITGGNKMHFVMKQIVAEGSNRDSTYFGKLFHFYQTDGQPLVWKKPIIVSTRSLLASKASILMKIQCLYLRLCGKFMIDKPMQMEFALEAILWMYSFS